MLFQIRYGVLLVASLAPATHASAADWTRFRGPLGAGVAVEAAAPSGLAPEDAAWRIDSGAGASSPIVAAERVFLTHFADANRTLRCLDLATGETLWEQTIQQVREELGTPPNDPATPTPVVDAGRVFALFPDAGMIACSLDGDLLWRRELPPFHSFHGIAASLTAHGDHVYLVADQLQNSYLQAFHTATGEPVWRAERVSGAVGGFATPVVRTVGQRQELIASGPREIVAYDPQTGDELWTLSGATNAPISTPLLDGDRLYVCEPFYEQNPFQMSALKPYDKNGDGRLEIEELPPGDRMRTLLGQIDVNFGDGDGVLTAEELETAFRDYVKSGGLAAIDLSDEDRKSAWVYQRTVPQIASPLLLDGLLYVFNDGGVLLAIDAAEGEVVKRGRLEQSGRQYYASPVAAGDQLVIVDTDGKAAVIRAGRDWEQLATFDLGEPCFATPAIAGDRLLIRTAQSLFCFRAK